MNWSAILEIAAGITTALSAVAFIAALYAWIQLSMSEESLVGSIRGAGVLRRKEVVDVLTSYRSDKERTVALSKLLAAENAGQQQVLKQIEGALSMWHAESTRLKDRRRRMVIMGTTCLLLAIVASASNASMVRPRAGISDSAASSELSVVRFPLRSEHTALTMDRLQSDLRSRGLFGWSHNPGGGLVAGRVVKRAVITRSIGYLFFVEPDRGAVHSFPSGLALLPRNGEVFTVSTLGAGVEDVVPGTGRVPKYSHQLEVIVELGGKLATYEHYLELVRDDRSSDQIQLKISRWDDATRTRVTNDERRTRRQLEVVVAHDETTNLLWVVPPSMHEEYSFRNAYVVMRSSNTIGLAGYSDWRLPTVEEALSLLRSVNLGAARVDDSFQLTPPSCWTADLMLARSDGNQIGPLAVHFESGSIEPRERAGVRLVRVADQPDASAIQMLDMGTRPESLSAAIDCHFRARESPLPTDLAELGKSSRDAPIGALPSPVPTLPTCSGRR